MLPLFPIRHQIGYWYHRSLYLLPNGHVVVRLTSVFVSQLLFIPAVMDSSFAIVTRDATSPW